MLRIAICCYGILIATVCGAQTATLKMRFIYDGPKPAAKQIVVPPGVVPPRVRVIDERLLVDPKSGGIENVLVYVYTGRGGAAIRLPPRREQKRRLTMANGRFDPHVLIARAGDEIELVARGPNPYSPSLKFLSNNSSDITLPPGATHLFPVPNPEPAPTNASCNIHGWMSAVVLVLDHPFAAKSDPEGNLVIEGLPVGTPLTFRAFHERGRIDCVEIAGEETIWRRSRFQLNLSPGVNDLGDVLVSAESFD